MQKLNPNLTDACSLSSAFWHSKRSSEQYWTSRDAPSPKELPLLVLVHIRAKMGHPYFLPPLSVSSQCRLCCTRHVCVHNPCCFSYSQLTCIMMMKGRLNCKLHACIWTVTGLLQHSHSHSHSALTLFLPKLPRPALHPHYLSILTLNYTLSHSSYPQATQTCAASSRTTALQATPCARTSHSQATQKCVGWLRSWFCSACACAACET